MFDDGDSGIAPTDRDVVQDFSRTAGDRIDLRAIDAFRDGDDDAFTWIGSQAFTGLGQLRWHQLGPDVVLNGIDVGTTAANCAILVRNVAGLQAGDVLLRKSA